MVQVNVTFTIFKQHLTQEKTVPYQMLQALDRLNFQNAKPEDSKKNLCTFNFDLRKQTYCIFQQQKTSYFERKPDKFHRKITKL